MRQLPKLAHRGELMTRLTELGNVIVLAEDFGDRRQHAVRKKETAQELVQSASARLERLLNQLAELTVRQTILAAGEKIETLYGRLGAHRKAMLDRPHLDSEHKQLLADAVALLKDVRPDIALDDAETLRPILVRRQRINGLSNQFERLVSRVKETAKQVRQAQANLEQAREQRLQLPDARSTDSLRRDVAMARKLGDLDNAIHADRLELAQGQAQCSDDLARLTLWRGALKDVAGVPVPMRESVDRFDARYEELSKHVQRLQDKQSEYQTTLHDAVRQLDEIHNTGAVPTEDDLNEARLVRDRTWGLLRRHWIDGEDVTAQASALHTELALPDAFESDLARADELADRLRREADRVHKQANLLATKDNATQSVAELAGQMAVCADNERTIDSEWVALWKAVGVQPRAPREMREWLNRIDNLREKAGRLSTLRQQANAHERDRDRHIDILKRGLRALGTDTPNSTSLEYVLARSEEVVAELDARLRAREKLDQAIETLRGALDVGHTEHQTAAEELNAWKRQWQDAVEGLCLGGEKSPLETADILERLRQMFDKQNEINKL